MSDCKHPILLPVTATCASCEMSAHQIIHQAQERIAEQDEELEDAHEHLRLLKEYPDTKPAEEVIYSRAELESALTKIADWNGSWGPFPETNKDWATMAVMAAREAIPPPPEEMKDE